MRHPEKIMNFCRIPRPFHANASFSLLWLGAEKLTCLRICHYFASAPSSSALYGPEPFSSSYHNALGHMAAVLKQIPIPRGTANKNDHARSFLALDELHFVDTSANCLSSTTGQQLRPFMASCCNPMVQLVSQVFPPSSENASSQCGLLSSFLQR